MMSAIWPYLRLLRPHQWVKNSFVLVGLLFGHAWHEPARVWDSVGAFVAFCLISSAVYVVNDLVDREQDKLHPQKSRRPLASGEARVRWAAWMAVLAAAFGLMLASAISGALLGLCVAYLMLNAAYTGGAKHVVLLDVFMISCGFMLRILAGTVGVSIEPSHWLLLCGFALTLFLGFAKRRAELAACQGSGAAHRKVLSQYTPALLDNMIAVVMSAVVVTYSLYTVSAETIQVHGTDRLIYTVPFVLYGLFRYLFLLHRRGGGGDPASELLADRHLQLAVAGWLVVTIALLRA
jgi:4-hydroxybenzoate polyprenyltransferase